MSLESSSSGGGRGRARRRRRWRGETDASRRRRISRSPFRRYFSRSRSRRSREPTTISGCGSGTHLLVAIPQGRVRGLRAVDPPRVFGDGPRGRGGGVVRLRAHDDRAGSAGAAIFSNTGKRALHLRHPGADGEGGRERRHRATSARPRARRRATLRGTRRAGEARSACLARGLARGALAVFRASKARQKTLGSARADARRLPRTSRLGWRSRNAAVTERGDARSSRERRSERSARGVPGARGAGAWGESVAGARRACGSARARASSATTKSRERRLSSARPSKCPRCFWLRRQKHETARRTNKTTRASGHASVGSARAPKITRPRVILPRAGGAAFRGSPNRRVRVRGEGRSVDRRLWIF